MLKKIFLFLLVLLGLGLLYLLFWPVPFEPVAYTPPPNPGFKGDFVSNTKLLATEKLLEGKGIGPEDITFGPDSLLYTGYEDGRIVRFSLDGTQVEAFTDMGSRPLGMKFDARGNLIVTDAKKGLLSIDSIGQITTLTNTVDGTTIFYADHLDIASNGIIYFSDATQRNRDIETEIWELQPTGRLLSYNPSTKETRVEMDNLRFANGVAIGPKEDYLLITETFGTRIHKFWLSGAKKGQSEIWVNEIPGFPDNISYNGNGIFWVAFPNQRVTALEPFYDKPFLRKMLARLPTSITGAEEPPPFGMIVGFDENGKVVHNLQDTSGRFHDITSANEFNGALYVGSLKMGALGKYKLN